MSTRHANDDSVYRDERHASSPEYQKGLQANMVAKRCALLTEPADRELIYFLLLLSHREGGLKQLVCDLIASYPDRFATLAMQELGTKPGKIYNTDQVRKIRHEFNGEFAVRGDAPRFAGRQMITPKHPCWQDLSSDEKERMLNWLEEERERQSKLPTSYPAEVFLNLCRRAAEEKLVRDISELCTDPKLKLAETRPKYFPALVETLREYMADWIEEKRASVVMTEVAEKVFETLDYCLDCRGMTMMHGQNRIGKNFTATAWCELHPGQARIIDVPPGSEDKGFFMAVADGIGVRCHQNSKAQELRSRVESVLRTGHLMLVFKNARNLWPQSNYRDALPFRISWIMSLMERAIPVALIIDHHFFAGEKRVARRAGWSSEQFFKDNFHCEALPEIPSQKDLTAMAKFFLPEGDKKSILLLTEYAETHATYIAGIQIAVTRARYLVRKDGREKVESSDIARAIQNAAIPSGAIINRALAQPEKPSRSRMKPAPPMAAPRRTNLISETIPTRESQPVGIE